MTTSYRSDVAFTPAVKAAQEARGSRASYQRAMERHDFPAAIDDDLAAFLQEQDSVYLGTASAGGQPYIQHRGGPRGFLKVLDENTLAFADYSGNRQYITVGNLSENDRAFLFVMDYAKPRRVKLWGRAEVREDDPSLVERVRDAGYAAKVERVIVFHIEAWDLNCRQHIPPRYSPHAPAPAGDEEPSTT